MFRDENRLRQQISYEAARIMVEDGVRDYQRAKQKACSRLGVSSRRSLPTNLEIEDAVSNQLSLTASESLKTTRQTYLVAALHMMERFSDYAPYLTGAALSGTITASRPVTLHVFPPTVEEFCGMLDFFQLNYELNDKRFRFARDKWQHVPVVQFVHTGIEFEVMVVVDSRLYPPLSTTDGRPVKRASLKRVRKILTKESSDADST